MVTIYFKEYNQKIKKVEGQEGQSIMDAGYTNNVKSIQALCGGCMSCATCHVYIKENNKIPPPEEEELWMLKELQHYKQNISRLSCQIFITEDMDKIEVEVAPPEE